MTIQRVFLLLSSVLFVTTAALAADHKRLSVSAASSLAAKLANENCQRRLNVSPFQPSAATPRLVDGRWHWHALVGYRHGDILAEVSFTEFGDDPAVQVNLMDNRFIDVPR